ncbi:LutC/YkgG family protein [Mucilaginibacter gotjawali]|uniref:Lactate utilization protein C n=2 Tax=Mucilaginibacter gotjawali TaxID=1550579 RepID=A0A0X8X3J6_9SPHI|nr:LUD domain-containing protein [Mucilaginibacter gotjawali]MBB3056330.1 L-lactate dehydrogenase complex protein LldG [Mucilaginibacter gotjawali]BAU55034.1 Lactate utilization protein C [Mucilaginibacter gotjawali]
MSSRDKILAAVAANQPAKVDLPDIDFLNGAAGNHVGKFTGVLTSIGGKAIEVNTFDDVKAYIKQTTNQGDRVVSTFSEMSDCTELINDYQGLPHDLQDIELAVIGADLGVAENGAVWVKGDLLNQRVVPFICQYLAVILKKEKIVATMHDAYEQIGSENYGFSTFIAGPSKTADIEQSLVLGAHGARTMTVFLME